MRTSKNHAGFLKIMRTSKNHVGFQKIMRTSKNHAGFLKITRTSKNHAGFLKIMRVFNKSCGFSINHAVFYKSCGFSKNHACFLCSLYLSVCNTDFYTYDSFLWSLRSSVCDWTSINVAQVSIDHAMQPGYLCAMRVFYASRCFLCS